MTGPLRVAACASALVLLAGCTDGEEDPGPDPSERPSAHVESAAVSLVDYETDDGHLDRGLRG